MARFKPSPHEPILLKADVLRYLKSTSQGDIPLWPDFKSEVLILTPRRLIWAQTRPFLGLLAALLLARFGWWTIRFETPLEQIVEFASYRKKAMDVVRTADGSHVTMTMAAFAWDGLDRTWRTALAEIAPHVRCVVYDAESG